MSAQPDASYFTAASHRAEGGGILLFNTSWAGFSGALPVPVWILLSFTSTADQLIPSSGKFTPSLILYFSVIDLKANLFKMILQTDALVYNVFIFKVKKDSFVFLCFNLSIKNFLIHILTSLPSYTFFKLYYSYFCVFSQQ